MKHKSEKQNRVGKILFKKNCPIFKGIVKVYIAFVTLSKYSK